VTTGEVLAGRIADPEARVVKLERKSEIAINCNFIDELSPRINQHEHPDDWSK
jgi:hypothetical protein